MILPQLEANNRAEVVGIFFDDNKRPREGDPTESGYHCSRKGNFVDDVRPLCLITRTGKENLAIATPYGTVESSRLLPDLYAALA